MWLCARSTNDGFRPSKWSNDDLRQSYRTLAQAVGVLELDIHLLMNDSLPGVNAGYLRDLENGARR